MGVSMCEYARQRGITEGAVRKAIKSGRISKEPDGTIDVERADKAWLANTSAPRLDVPESNQPQQKQLIPVPKSATDITRDTLAKHGQALAEDDAITYHHAKEANEILKNELIRLDVDVRKGKLIDRQKVYDHIFQLARQERDAWLAWPTRIANQLAAEEANLNDPSCLQLLLERYVRDYISELGDIRPNFTREPVPIDDTDEAIDEADVNSV